jgi:hypothetical protein
MIAQKVVDAKQPEPPIGALVTLPDSIAAAFRTFSHKHLPLEFSPKKADQPKGINKAFGYYDRYGLLVLALPGSGDVTMAFPVANRARNNSISLEIRSAPASRSLSRPSRVR